MQKFVRLLSLLVLTSLSCWWITGCNSLNPVPVADRSITTVGKSQHLGRSYEYVVKSGDTLFAIARLHGLTVAQVAQMNDIEPPYTIYPGDTIIVDSRWLQQQEQRQVAMGRQETELASKEDSHSKSVDSTSSIQSQQRVHSTGVQSQNQKQTQQTTSSSTSNSTVATTPSQSTVVETTQVSQQSASVQTVKTIQSAQAVEQKIASLPKGWEWPVDAKPKSSNNNDEGLNYFLNEGTKVVAAASGKVSYAGVSLSDFRYMILVKTADDYVIQYDFNTELTVEEDDIVRKGQTLFRVKQDSSVQATDHPVYREVYFAIWKRGVPQDPKNLIKN